MRINHETYRRAAVAAIFASIFHLVLTAVVFLLGYVLKDDATRIAAYSMLCGIPVWVVLILLFHQHRLERLESLEHEQLRTRAEATGSIFDFDENEVPQHASRLKWMHRYLVPASSLFIAALLIAIGWWQRGVVSSRGDQGPVVAEPGSAGYGVGITAAIALVCFVVSWFLGGMSRQPAWRLLRAGATATIGAALLNAALAVGYGFRLNGNQDILAALAFVFPIYMIVLGLEVIIAFVLNLYTPRKPGEYPQPAFDSRVLGLLAAPESVVKSINDAINYQFGFSVTSTWFYQLLSRQILPLLGFVVLLIALLRCVAIVQPGEQAIVTSFGDLRRDGHVFESGAVVKWPWERLERYPVSQIHQVLVGTASEDGHAKVDDKAPILWDNAHTLGQEELIIVGPGRIGAEQETENSGSGNLARSIAVVNAEVPVQFRIKDGRDADGTSELLNYINFVGGDDSQREALIRQIATRVVNRRLAGMSIEQVLGPRRAALSDDLRGRIQTELDRWNSGIQVVFVGVAGIHPPKDVAASFEQVLEARETRESTIQDALRVATERLARAAGSVEQAQTIAREIEKLRSFGLSDEGYAEQSLVVEQVLLQAGGSAAREILEAKADRWTTQNDKLATAIRHKSRLMPYEQAPELYSVREYLNTLRRALEGRQLVIIPDGVMSRITIDLKQDPTMINLTDIGASADAAERLRNE
ncbi:MAG: hypothetical protein IT430_01140 [Phycisphaerales bacterium]|nr:hypothetical protein [Phycisphaerales bacterium]